MPRKLQPQTNLPKPLSEHYEYIKAWDHQGQHEVLTYPASEYVWKTWGGRKRVLEYRGILFHFIINDGVLQHEEERAIYDCIELYANAKERSEHERQSIIRNPRFRKSRR